MWADHLQCSQVKDIPTQFVKYKYYHESVLSMRKKTISIENEFSGLFTATMGLSVAVDRTFLPIRVVILGNL
jgi:hypothetical protein